MTMGGWISRIARTEESQDIRPVQRLEAAESEWACQPGDNNDDIGSPPAIPPT